MMKRFAIWLLSIHFLESWRPPADSWKKKGPRFWCFLISITQMSLAFVASYIFYLFIFHSMDTFFGKIPVDVSYMPLFAAGEYFREALTSHLQAAAFTTFFPIHRFAYGLWTGFVADGFVETSEDAWPPLNHERLPENA